jgi:hypothetical protein
MALRRQRAGDFFLQSNVLSRTSKRCEDVMYKHFILAVVAMLTFALFPDAADAQGKWKAAAVSSSGQVYFAWGNTEADALSGALQKCNAGRRNECRNAPDKSIAVETWWWLVVAECNGKKFVGGSQWNADVALENAKAKAPSRLQNACLHQQELAGTVPPVYSGQGDNDPSTRPAPR